MDYSTYIGPRGSGKKYLVNSNGNTDDIIGAILAADKQAATYVQHLAPVLIGRSDLETCQNIWNFWKQHVFYREDPDGYQYIKSPREVYHSGFADCKSYSIAVAACLKQLGIPHSYRFTTETPGKPYHHVYIVAHTSAGDVVIDCVLSQFNHENSYVGKKDVRGHMLASARIGATDQTITDVEYSWLNYVENYKRELDAIKSNTLSQIEDSIRSKYANQPLKKSEFLKMVRKRYPDLMNVGAVLIYHYWDNSKGPFPQELAPKKQYGTDLHSELIGYGFRAADLYALCSLGCYNLYGVPAEYVLYRALNITKYGQPWTPKNGVPYWNQKLGTLVANGATLDDTIKLAVCFPYNGGIARPYGQPYWSVGGFVVANGASENYVTQWLAQNPRPASIQNNIEATAAIPYLQLYAKWRKGQMPGLPQTTVGQGKPAVGQNPPVINMETGKIVFDNAVAGAKIGLALPVIVAIISACATAVSAITAGVVAAIQANAASQAGQNLAPSNIPNYPMDFKETYTTANGCTMFTNSNGQYKMCCPNGQCVDNPNLNDPANQPAAGANALTGGGSKWLLIGGAGLVITALALR